MQVAGKVKAFIEGECKCTLDLEELGQPLDEETHSGEDSGGSPSCKAKEA